MDIKANILFMGLLLLVFPCLGQTVTDIDGNVYNTVAIGNQVWMKENLRVTKFNDGTEIPVVTDNEKWSELTTPGTCTYNNTTNAYTILTYGRLYNWFAAASGKLCPAGWHVPTNDEWDALINCLGGMYPADGKLRETGTQHWKTTIDSVDNSSGFTALPAGFRHPWYGTFYNFGDASVWWSSSEFFEPSRGGFMCIATEFKFASTGSYIKQEGSSVRCLCDKSSGIGGGDKLGSIYVYPNPAKDILYIRSAEAIQSALEIVNLQGETALYKTNASYVLDISRLDKGIYIIKIVQQGQVKVAKFVKE